MKRCAADCRGGPFSVIGLMPSSLKTRSIRSLLWSLAENAGVALLSLGSFVLMARLLDPADFGVVALSGVFVVSFNLVVGSTLADGIIQRADLSPGHVDTAFWGTLAIGVLLGAICVVAAGSIATALREPGIAQVLPWLAIVPVASAFGAIPIALQRRKLQFRNPALCSLIGRICGAAAGVAMALGGLGLWSLVGQQITAAIATNLAVLLSARWRPGLGLSAAKLRELWGFGAHVSASQVVSTAGEQAITMLVGVLFGSTLLGYFTVAWRMVQLVKALIAGTVYHVAFSAFARLQNDRRAVTDALLNATQISCLVGFPIGIGMAAVASPAIAAVFGERWLASADVFAILALEMIPAFYVLFFSSCYRALGRPSWTLALALAYFAVGISGTILAAQYGLTAIALAWVAKSVLLLPINLLLMRRLIDVPVMVMLSLPLGPLAAAGAMAIGVRYLLQVLDPQLGAVSQLLVAIPSGAAIYAVAVLLLARRPVLAAWATFANLLRSPTTASE